MLINEKKETVDENYRSPLIHPIQTKKNK